jgi:hypothetical protein
MKHAIIFPLLFILLQGHTQTQSPEADKVNKLHLKKFEWFTKKNYDSVEWILDKTLRYTHSNGWVQTKQEVINDLKAGKPVYNSIQVEQSSVAFYENGTAIVNGKGTFAGLMADGAAFNLKLAYTEVYIRVKKEWKLVNRLTTKLPN